MIKKVKYVSESGMCTSVLVDTTYEDGGKHTYTLIIAYSEKILVDVRGEVDKGYCIQVGTGELKKIISDLQEILNELGKE